MTQGFETRQIHAGQVPDSETGARTVPIYQTTSFVFRDAEHAANLFALGEIGNIYTRIANPTTSVLEARLSDLEGGTATAVGLPGALCVASGQAATALAITNICDAGDHIVTASALYGGTYNQFNYTLPKMGIEVTFVKDADDLDEWRGAVRPNTKLFYGETVGNPKNNCIDIEGVSTVAHDAGIPLILDNTVPSPYLINPLKWGADILIESTTKFIGGHGTSIGGVIIDGGNFDFGDAEKFPSMNNPDPSYNGLAFWPGLGAGSYIIKARVQGLRDLGAAMSPTNAFHFIQGCETLSLRMERHCQNAQVVAEFLDGHDKVESVQYAGLASSPWHERMAKYTEGRGFCSVPAFIIKGGREAGEKFVNATELHSHVANIGDVRSLIIHPGSTTHSQLNEAEQLASGVAPGLIRLSVGLETIGDIIADLELGFEAV